MKLTTKSEYSLLALLFLARHSDSGFITIEQISHACDIPPKYLEQLLGALRSGRILKARRGVGGGYALARDASQISVAEVIRMMDGALAPTESVSEFFFSKTPLMREERLLDELRIIRNFAAKRLEKLTLSKLV
ncbi:MAG: Rrf2 family transcriptional regulator [Candidatus Alcyoniella australis]|nr:Rrf2 family transcriptional regulator [Candidatus Alcyoniella australis]